MSNKLTADDPRLTAFVLGEMDESSSRAFAAELAAHPELAEEVAALRAMAEALTSGFVEQPAPSLSDDQRRALDRAGKGSVFHRPILILAAFLIAALALSWIVLHPMAPETQVAEGPLPETAQPVPVLVEQHQVAQQAGAPNPVSPSEVPAVEPPQKDTAPVPAEAVALAGPPSDSKPVAEVDSVVAVDTAPATVEAVAVEGPPSDPQHVSEVDAAVAVDTSENTTPVAERVNQPQRASTSQVGAMSGTITDGNGQPLPGVTVVAEGPNLTGSRTAVTNENGDYRMVFLPQGPYELTALFLGFHPKKAKVELMDHSTLDLKMEENETAEALIVSAGAPVVDHSSTSSGSIISEDFFNKLPTGRSVSSIMEIAPGVSVKDWPNGASGPENQYVTAEKGTEEGSPGESYKHLSENSFTVTSDDPRSTFSLDVDTAAYANVRRFLVGNSLPPVDAVRLEELVNYFSYDDPGPKGIHPLGITTAMAAAPWAPDHQLLRVGIKARSLFPETRPACNLVFLLDVSGSMNTAEKLPLVKQSLMLLADNLDHRDKVGIVVYAGASGVVLEPTPGNNKATIAKALDNLRAAGGTNGAAGIETAYRLAADNFIKGGVNRVILATDGDFNLGFRDDSALTRLIEHQRESDIFLTVLGFGMGNYKDDKLELLSGKGNGNAAYIDSLDEAYKVMTEEVGGTLFTVAKDVKMQVEFNPARVKQWRLVGYENRLLAHQDFNDDRKDAAEVGAGHSLVVFYELVPHTTSAPAAVDPLKYQQPGQLSEAALGDEWLTLKMRYKQPEGNSSQLLELPVKATPPVHTDDFFFGASVAAFAMKLRQSKQTQHFTWEQILHLAQDHLGADLNGHRSAFLDLVEKAKSLDTQD